MINIVTEQDENYRRTSKQLLKSMKLKRKLEFFLEFYIPFYIIDDLIENENYKHLNSMINLATINNRITENNSFKLKVKLKELFYIDNVIDENLLDKFIKDIEE